MKFVVVDIQGYFIPEFYPKELALFDGKTIKNYAFKSKKPLHALSEDCKNQVRYLYGNHHGIHYSYGDTEHDEIYSILCTYLRDVDVIYVKGEVKRSFLIKTYSDMRHIAPCIVNLEHVNGDIPNLKKCSTLCIHHSLEICVCSTNNACLIYEYIRGLLPQ